MDLKGAENHYLAARKMGVKEYSKNISKGQTGYLPFLEGVLKNIEIVYELDLGIIDLPLKKIIGTYTYARSRSFASNYMPLLTVKTEFASKWSSLCSVHINEGIRDPIKVYEYLNWFYVVEGNKRVSVLKYFDAYSIQGQVSRLVPKKDDSDVTISIYYEFLEFYKKTGINLIWFTKRNSFHQLTGYLDGFNPELNPENLNKYKYFLNFIYMPFRKVYLELGGQKLPITTGDAFLEYIKVYGMPEEIDDLALRARLSGFIIELQQMSGNKTADIQTIPVDNGENIISALTTFVRPKKSLKVAFAYASDAKSSSWTYAQEMGRNHVNNVFGDTISTSFIDNVPESLDAYDSLRKLAEEGNDVVFATSPSFINATLKAALEFPETKFLNCSETHSYKHVNTYFGRIYEPRFLAGMVAGSVTRSNIVGYVGTNPIPGVINGINSFAIGARMVNANVKVKVEWLNCWDSQKGAGTASKNLIRLGADVISHHDTLSNREFSKEYGVYAVLRSIDNDGRANEYIAAPVWNWGIFYEKMLRNLINSWKPFGSEQKVINFWWGMDSGIVDFFYSKRLVPRETQKLLDFLKSMIINGTFHPFTGPIYDQNGVLRVKQEQLATREQIIGMDWFADIIESELPRTGDQIPETGD
ncbi:MAG: BMP family ABC transporter substrate-binding protein [Clostridiaceae bacterium]